MKASEGCTMEEMGEKMKKRSISNKQTNEGFISRFLSIQFQRTQSTYPNPNLHNTDGSFDAKGGDSKENITQLNEITVMGDRYSM